MYDDIPPAIYVVCAATFDTQSGHYGTWVDITTVTEMKRTMDRFLEASPSPNASEYLIHDFAGLQGIEFGEEEELEKVAAIGALVREFGAPFADYYHFADLDLMVAAQRFGVIYMDECETLEEYAHEWFERAHGTFRVPGFHLEVCRGLQLKPTSFRTWHSPPTTVRGSTMGNGLRRLLLWVVGGGRACRRDTSVSRTARPPLPPPTKAGRYVETRVINGQRCTNRKGAAEYLNRSLISIKTYSGLKGRARTGWPEPIAHQDRADWFSLEALDVFRDTYLASKEAAGLPRARKVPYAADPSAMIDDAGFQTLINVNRGTWVRYVHDSQPDWDKGLDGYLPRPDRTETVRGGRRRYWHQHRAAGWHNNRTGTAIQPRAAANPN